MLNFGRIPRTPTIFNNFCLSPQIGNAAFLVEAQKAIILP
ncbi:hypothetical protein MYAER_3545 [Microcystis aeruginosa NIES-2549]|uniref:Uncharacterized protein n=1 Tax=Microcystis aeruginosa NIES-2549 TaxID=1641812 RepID=A0A0F6RN71_MICAE|nr:hypothetical protein MYAER_3545 [Microcystis aeruginosa NIES-2549]AOC54289.1 hypothetical protein amyaer_3586 [Microcystis aeruginosa NIES-2481]